MPLIQADGTELNYELAGPADAPVVMMVEIRDRIAGAVLHVLPEAAHLLAIEQSETVTATLTRFLGQ